MANHVQPKIDVDQSQREAFRKLAGDDMEVDPFELKELLNTAFSKGFCKRCFFCLTVAMCTLAKRCKIGLQYV